VVRNEVVMWRRIFAVVLRVAAVLMLLVAFSGPLLRGAARWWIVDEVTVAAEAIVVLGGGEDYRPFAAARLWKKGLAPVILVPEVKRSPTEELGLRPGTTEVILGVLKAEGVPDHAVVKIGKDVSSTREEALAVKEWAAGAGSVQEKGGTGWRLLIPTDPFPTRRTNWLFEKTIPGCDATVVRTDPRDIDVERWWTSERSLISFQNEVVKYVLCRVKY
jgi:uncharacterized SAM-binding protein YcdF (DUF218 family)